MVESRRCQDHNGLKTLLLAVSATKAINPGIAYQRTAHTLQKFPVVGQIALGIAAASFNRFAIQNCLIFTVASWV